MPGSSASTLGSWTYQPADPSTTISHSPMPVHMNLYLYQGVPPTNGQGVEIVIHNFSFNASPPASAPAMPVGGMLLVAAWLMGIGSFWIGRTRASLSA